VNQFYIPFNLRIVDFSGAWKINFISERIKIQTDMKAWCEEMIGEAGYPYWQFAQGNEYIHYNEYVNVYQGIYIFDPATQTAFKLKYAL